MMEKSLARLVAHIARALLASAVMLSACGDEDASISLVPDEADRTLALANEIVLGMVEHYADRSYGGEKRAYAVDLSSLDAPEIDAPHWEYELRDGLRRIAETLSTEGASWTLRFFRIEQDPLKISYTLFAMVVDLHAEFCCLLESAGLSRSATGWEVTGFWPGGHARETNEFRQERVASGRELLR